MLRKLNRVFRKFNRDKKQKSGKLGFNPIGELALEVSLSTSFLSSASWVMSTILDFLNICHWILSGLCSVSYVHLNSKLSYSLLNSTKPVLMFLTV